MLPEDAGDSTVSREKMGWKSVVGSYDCEKIN